MKQTPQTTATISALAISLYQKLVKPKKPFSDSKTYWIDRYNAGGDSGSGSYKKLAQFKAEILNNFVQKNNITTVIEFGCGDGNQLKLAQYPRYIGFDVSPKAIALCQKSFRKDSSKTFQLLEEYQQEIADLTLSLDVIYHLVEDEVFTAYMNTLFDAASQFVIIYASNTDITPKNQETHVRHRAFSQWIEHKKPDWHLLQHIPNRHPFCPETKTGSFADFYIYQKG